MLSKAAVLALLLALLVPTQVSAIGPAPASSASCPPGIGIGLLQFPKERADDPRAQAYVIDSVAPGATFRRQFQVCNGTGSAVTAELYATAADVRDGSFVPAEGRQLNDVAWAIEIEPSRLTIPAGEPAVATAVFRVPRDAEQGEQYGVIFAEIAGEGSAVQARSRAGIRVYLDIAAGGEARSDFVVDSLQGVRNADGTPAVIARVTNTGRRALDLTGELLLTDGPGGLSGGPFVAELGTTLGIEQSAMVTVPLDRAISGGPWTATLTLTSGLLERQARAQVIFPDDAGEENPPVQAESLSPVEDPDLVVPFAIGLLFLLFVLLLIVAYLTSRRKARERAAAG